MKPLSLKQSQACENATHPRCRCRCGGAFHGAKRVEDTRRLPRDDPHAPSESQLELGVPEVAEFPPWGVVSSHAQAREETEARKKNGRKEASQARRKEARRKASPETPIDDD